MASREAQIHSVALFFFYSFLDESKAKRATFSAISKLRRKSESTNIELIRLMSSVHGAVSERDKSVGSGAFESKSFVSLPEGVSLGAWREFQKNAHGDEVLAVIWNRILGFDEKEIARGLGLSQGTIRYRLAHGIRNLSENLKGEI